MPTVFLSYARADLPLIEELEARLQSAASDITIWRDQEKLYGGQKWPKILGEAIADQDVFLLAWSKSSAASHFVEFEWCTAIALKKTIVPCLLDETALAPILSALHGHRLNDVNGLVKTLAASPLADIQRRKPVIDRLSEIVETEEKAVLKQAKAVFAQQQWTVQGNVYQAGGDIHIHNEPAAPEKAKPLVEKWQTWVGLAVALLTGVTLITNLLGLQGTVGGKNGSGTEELILEQPLAGKISDVAGNPLLGVTVSLSDPNQREMTDELGKFQFLVKGPKQKEVDIQAQLVGFKPKRVPATLGTTTVSFSLERES